MFPLRPGSWKWAGRENKQRVGAHTRHANTFTYVNSQEFQKTQMQLYDNTCMLLCATPSHLEEGADVEAGFI